MSRIEKLSKLKQCFFHAAYEITSLSSNGSRFRRSNSSFIRRMKSKRPFWLRVAGKTALMERNCKHSMFRLSVVNIKQICVTFSAGVKQYRSSGLCQIAFRPFRFTGNVKFVAQRELLRLKVVLHFPTDVANFQYETFRVSNIFFKINRSALTTNGNGKACDKTF